MLRSDFQQDNIANMEGGDDFVDDVDEAEEQEFDEDEEEAEGEPVFEGKIKAEKEAQYIRITTLRDQQKLGEKQLAFWKAELRFAERDKYDKEETKTRTIAAREVEVKKAEDTLALINEALAEFADKPVETAAEEEEEKETKKSQTSGAGSGAGAGLAVAVPLVPAAVAAPAAMSTGPEGPERAALTVPDEDIDVDFTKR